MPARVTELPPTGRVGIVYQYQANDTALRPDAFLQQGGGDCEDWAFVSAGLMRFWGLTAYVGSFSAPTDSQAHAVCLVRATEVPSGYGWYELSGVSTWSGEAVCQGRYVVIDYGEVGRTSSAVGPG